MPFGINTTGSTFIIALNSVFGSNFSDFLDDYVDEIVISSSTFEDHIRHMHLVLGRLREAGLTLRLDKTLFAR